MSGETKRFLVDGVEVSMPTGASIYWIRVGKSGKSHWKWCIENGFVSIGWKGAIDHLAEGSSFLEIKTVRPRSGSPSTVRVLTGIIADTNITITRVRDFVCEQQTGNRDEVLSVFDQKSLLKEKLSKHYKERAFFKDSRLLEWSVEDLRSKIVSSDRRSAGAQASQIGSYLSVKPNDLVFVVDKSRDLPVAFGQFIDQISDDATVAAAASPTLPLPPDDHTMRPVKWLHHRMVNGDKLDSATQIMSKLKEQISPLSKNFPLGTCAKYNPKEKNFGSSSTSTSAKNPGTPDVTQKNPIHGDSKSAAEGGRQNTLRRSSNMVLEGVPGTGKTFAIKQYICKDWQERTGRTLVGQGREAYAITLHPATTYEDFVEGLRPVAAVDDAGAKGAKTDTNTSPGPRHVDDAKPVSIDGKTKVPHQGYFHVKQPGIHGGTSSGGSTFRMQDGFFLRACAEAANNPAKDYVVLLDEINRCNVPKVMGDLLTTIERSKRATWDGDDDNGHWNLSDCQVVTLPGSKRLFFVPDNVYVVATMNTTDRSVAPLDAALRRRFAFVRLWPMGFGPSREVESADAVAETVWAATASSETVPEFIAAVTAWWTLNTKLMEKGPDAMLGHSYLFDLAKDMGAERDVSEGRALVLHHWNFHILPQLVDVAVSNGLESELVQGGDKLGVLTKDLFPQDPDKQASGFKLTGSMPSSTGLLQVPTLTLVDHGSARGSLR